MKTLRRDFLKIAAVAALGWGVRPATELMAAGGGGREKGCFSHPGTRFMPAPMP